MPFFRSTRASLFSTQAGIAATKPAIWLDADDGIGVYNDGDVVTGFRNRGSAGNLVVASGLTGPVWKSGLFGGKPCLSFNGGQGLDTAAGSIAMTSFAVFAVALISSTTTAHCIYQFNDGVDSTWLMAYINPVIIALKPPGTSSYGVGSSPISRDLRKLWRHRFVDTHASHQIWQNSIQLAPANDGSSGNPGGALTHSGFLRVGANTAGTVGLTGYIRHFLAYLSCPSDSVTATIEAALTADGVLQ